jgi:hypothetical protein
MIATSMPAFAQAAISAKAGMVHVADGEVFLAEKQVELQPNAFPAMNENQVLRTAEGRAEVLLAPGTFLRMGEDSAFKLLNNRISDTRLLLEKGKVLIEVVDYLDGNYMTVAAGDFVFNPQKAGLFEISANPVRVRVWAGEVRVSGSGDAMLVKAGRELTLQGQQWAVAKFDDQDTDALYRWARRRSEYLAKANMAAARSAGTGMVSGDTRGRWIFNPWMGMMTFVPFGNTFRSPFGFNYFTPWTVMNYYVQPVFAGGGGGFGGGSSPFERSMGGSYSGGWAGGGAPIRSVGGGYSGGSGGGYSGGYAGGGAASPGASSGGAGASAPVRGGDSSGGRGGAGGGGRQ